MCELLTDDGRWIDVELEAGASYVDWEETRMAFLIDPENQFLAEDNNWHQLLTEKSQIPLSLRKQSVFQDGKNDEEELKLLGDEIFSQSFEERIAEEMEKANKNLSWEKFYKLACILAGTFLLALGMHYLWG